MSYVFVLCIKMTFEIFSRYWTSQSHFSYHKPQKHVVYETCHFLIFLIIFKYWWRKQNWEKWCFPISSQYFKSHYSPIMDVTKKRKNCIKIHVGYVLEFGIPLTGPSALVYSGLCHYLKNLIIMQFAMSWPLQTNIHFGWTLNNG